MIVARGRELIRERMRGPRTVLSATEHAEAAVRWIFAAQDATPDGGVSHSYHVGDRWMRSYPETTGYIIPTLLNWSVSSDPGEAAKRALRMADWEVEVQRPDGAICDLISGAPVVFDTGQVLFGFLAAHRHSADERYLHAARRAAEWLIGAQDGDGVWRSASDCGGSGRVYNARTAWALLECGRVLGDDRFDDAVRRFLDWTLTQEVGDGWFDRNCLDRDAAPLLHTIAYTARGHLECGLLLGEEKYVEASRRTVRALAGRIADDGHMAGRFDRNWSPAVRWVCLTGLAQTSILWRRHAAIGGASDARFSEKADRANHFLIRTHDTTSSHPGLYGGIRGSFPLSGEYGRWRVLNWATKFFVDALMLAHDPAFLRFPG